MKPCEIHPKSVDLEASHRVLLAQLAFPALQGPLKERRGLLETPLHVPRKAFKGLSEACKGL